MRITLVILSIVYLFIVCACSSKASFTLSGVTNEQAIVVLTEYTEGQRSAISLSEHIVFFSQNIAQSFNWSDYWSTIEKKRLYQSLSTPVLESLLDLNRVSCSKEDVSSFGQLLLSIAQEENRIFFYHYLFSEHTSGCGVPIDTLLLGSIIEFLFEKRALLEVTSLQEALQNNSLTLEDKVTSYPYTTELINILESEWFTLNNQRSFGAFLSGIDTDQTFLSDSRMMSLMIFEERTTQALLLFELQENVTVTNLKRDLLWAFEQDDMSEILSSRGYHQVFASKEMLSYWKEIWLAFTEEYPSARQVENKLENVQYLLSLYSFPCSFWRSEPFYAYRTLVTQWDLNTQEKINTFCN